MQTLAHLLLLSTPCVSIFLRKFARMKQNSIYSWYLACRPKTLSGALVSVFCASALAMVHLRAAQQSFDWKAAGLCALFASLMQIASNLINDLYDFQRGTDDEERLGPERACAQGWITPRAMRIGIAVVCLMAASVGLQLVQYVEWWMVLPVVAVVIVGAFLYTVFGSYHGLGDLLVYVFFGYVPTCGTYLVLTGTLDWEVFLLATAVALVVDTLLVVNNYRDRIGDARAGKNTIIVRIGQLYERSLLREGGVDLQTAREYGELRAEAFGHKFYFWQGIFAWLFVMLLGFHGHHMFLTVIYALLHSKTSREMHKIRQGRALNAILGKTSMGMMLFAALTVLGLLL